MNINDYIDFENLFDKLIKENKSELNDKKILNFLKNKDEFEIMVNECELLATKIIFH